MGVKTVLTYTEAPDFQEHQCLFKVIERVLDKFTLERVHVYEELKEGVYFFIESDNSSHASKDDLLDLLNGNQGLSKRVKDRILEANNQKVV